MGQYDIYAMPNISAEGGLYELFTYINNVSEGIFFPIFLGVAWIVMFLVGMRVSSPAKALTFSCFIGMVLSMPLAVLGLINPKLMYVMIIGLAIGVFWVKQEAN